MKGIEIMYPNISYEEIKDKLKADEYLIIDVRTQMNLQVRQSLGP